MLAEMLRREDVTVEYEPAQEQRNAGDVASEIVTGLVVSGLYSGIQAAIRKFTDRTHGEADVTIEDEDED